jgi:hypothetical protein
LLLVFRAYDRITGNPAQPKSIIIGVIHEVGGFRLLKDWQVLQTLNTISTNMKLLAADETAPASAPRGDQPLLMQAEAEARAVIPKLDLPFRQPELELLGIISNPGPK